MKKGLSYFQNTLQASLIPKLRRTRGKSKAGGDTQREEASRGRCARLPTPTETLQPTELLTPTSPPSLPGSRQHHTKQQYFFHQDLERVLILSGVLLLAFFGGGGCCWVSEYWMPATMAASKTSLRFFCVKAEHSM